MTDAPRAVKVADVLLTRRCSHSEITGQPPSSQSEGAVSSHSGREEKLNHPLSSRRPGGGGRGGGFTLQASRFTGRGEDCPLVGPALLDEDEGHPPGAARVHGDRPPDEHAKRVRAEGAPRCVLIRLEVPRFVQVGSDGRRAQRARVAYGQPL
eukprot:CAMPEP_0206240654 /NCGR_PEP_ID=MMETSP0047_2-20121206/16055_1 /ASSEMBLY_ACC=CAM_ASM_000192 /TAXON_ID=195065 /ORGANISM="Chroomonas mesostigmatica_cf, Strain CCMP1168" /LENGTH=152 /DNA_ID=CAMNT_0053665453 /DNA_START=441 /DNA_END=899 /DNA_ORIENTATION=+